MIVLPLYTMICTHLWTVLSANGLVLLCCMLLYTLWCICMIAL